MTSTNNLTLTITWQINYFNSKYKIANKLIQIPFTKGIIQVLKPS
jgi:hypothetical protein